jgi:hypothetical protein
MCEDIRGLQNWVNATFNQVTDAVTISVLPPIAVPPNSEVMKRNLKWAPLEKWPLNNPAEAQMLGVPPSAMAGVTAAFGQMNFVKDAKERVTGTTDLMIGKQERDRTTAFEIGARVEAGNQVYEYHVSTVQFGMTEEQGFEAYAECFMNILSRFMPHYPLLYQSGEGSERWSVIQPQAYQGNYRFCPHGSTSSNNPRVRYQRTMTTRQTVSQSPFCQISPLDSPQAVLAKIRRWYHIEREYVLALGNNHVEAYIGPEPRTIQEALSVAFKMDPMATQAILQNIQMQEAQQRGLPPGPGLQLVPVARQGAPGPYGQGEIPEAQGGSGGLSGFASETGVEAPDGSSF